MSDEIKEAPAVAATRAKADTTASTLKATLPTEPLRVPQALRELKGWLLWRAELSDGAKKPSKQPYYDTFGRKPSGDLLSAWNCSKLRTFDDAISEARKADDFGVGFRLQPKFNIVALDFDNCVQDGVVNPEVLELVKGTYAEYSPSGRGVRAFMVGNLGNRKSPTTADSFGFEVFSDNGSYVTVTGNALPGAPNEIAALTDCVREFYARRFPGSQNHHLGDEDPVEIAPLGLTEAEIQQALAVLPDDLPYEASIGPSWLGVGMALHHETGGDGFEIWDNWSAQSPKYTSSEYGLARWESFGRNSGSAVTAGSLLHWANELGAGISRGRAADRTEFEVLPPIPGELEPAPNFERNAAGKILATKENILLALKRSDLCGARLRHDVFRDEIMVGSHEGDAWRAFKDTDYTDLCLRLENGPNGFRDIPREKIRDVVAWVAERNQFDSARYWLELQAWDGVQRVERSIVDYFGAEDTPYTRAIGLYLWTALAGRVLQPGIKADMVPVAVGAQGTMKSSTVAAISPATDYFLELDLAAKDDDQARLMRGKLVIELGELRGMRARDAEHLKAFITRSHENWVPKFKEMSVQYARRCVFFGTTNRDEFLSDDTGHRRFLPFSAGVCDPSGLARDRGQLWAEGRELFKDNGVSWAQAEQLARAEHDKFVEHDAWEPMIEAWLSNPSGLAIDTLDGKARDIPRKPVTAVQVLTSALHLRPDQCTHANKERAGRALKQLGYRPGRWYIDGRQQRGYMPPEKQDR